MIISPWQPKPEPTTWGTWRDGLPLLRVLEASRARDEVRVMLSGPPPPPDWFLEATPNWQALRVFPDHETPAARYRHLSGHTVEVRRAAEWFGRGEFTDKEAAEAWELTRYALGRSGHSGAAMFRSPGATGLDLWLRTHGGDVDDPIDAELQDLIRSTTPQHRIELFAPTSEAPMPAFWLLDGRWMYAALTRELGVGPARMLTGDAAIDYAVDEYARGRFDVTFTAPEYWRDLGLPGLLLSPVGDNAVDGWHTPLSGRAWIDASELQLARRYEWQCRVHAAIALDKGRPLDTWTSRLVRARAQHADNPLVANALRSVLLHTIGSFHSSGRAEQTVTASPMTAPIGDDWAAPIVLADGRALWQRQAPEPSPRAAAMRHPEWSAAIWSRAHVRIVESQTAAGRRSGAIATRPGTLVSIYGDALAVTVLPDWARDPDDGKPGRLRVKGHLCGPIDWPRTARERDEITRAATAAGTTCKKGCK